MISEPISEVAPRLQTPLQFFSDEESQVINCCAFVEQYSGLRISSAQPCTLDSLVHLDANASASLRYAAETREPVCFRASIRIRTESLLPVYWTVVPNENGYNWFGFPANEKDLVESRLKELELILASFHDVVFELDADGTFLNFWVKDPDKLFVPPAFFLGRNALDVIREHMTPLYDLLADAYHDAQTTGNGKIVEYQLPDLPGWFSCRFSPLHNAESTITGMLVIITDISVQKNLEINLRQSEERHRDLFENANDIIYVIDADSNVVSMNRMGEQLLGYAEAELLGRSSHLFFAPEKLANATEQGRFKWDGIISQSRYESEFISRSGKRIPVEISSRIIYKNSRPTGIHVTARDISLQRKSQLDLAKSEARFRFLSENSRDMVCLHRPNGDYIYVSPAVKFIAGYDPDELIGKSPYDFFHPEDTDSVIRFAHYRNSIGLSVSPIQYRYKAKDGAYIWLESVSQPILEDGEVIYLQTNSRDISDRKRDEQNLIEKDKLSSALSRVSGILLEEQDLSTALIQCFPLLGMAMEAECLFILRNNQDDPELYQIWCASGPCSVKEKQHMFLRAAVLTTSEDSRKTGHVDIFQLATTDRPEIKEWMTELGYQSLVLTPVITSDGYWGLIGCGQKLTARSWSRTLQDTLTTFASTVSTVMDRHLRDHQLKRSEERFKALFLNSQDIVFVVKQNGEIAYVTPSIRQILGYVESDLLGSQSRQLVHQDQQAAFDLAFQQIASGKQTNILLPVMVINQQGNWVWMELKGQSQLQNPNINGVILSLRDISEYVEIEKTLKDYSRKITDMLESITDGFIAMDTDFSITMFNKVAQELLNNDDRLVEGRKIWDLVTNIENNATYEALKKAAGEHRTIRFEEFVPDLNRWFEASAYPYGHGLFVYFKDVSEKKRHEKLLRLEKEVLEMHAGASVSLAGIADHLLAGLESMHPEMACAICMVKHNLQEATCLSAPGLPAIYKTFVRKTPLDVNFTICARAIQTRSEVIIENIETSDLVPETRAAAVSLGIKASWTMPIISSLNEVLGTFVVYFKTPRKPSAEEMSVINRAKHIITMIIENRLNAEKLWISNERYLLATRAANEAIWDWDAEEQVSFWGEGFNTLFGYPSGHYPGQSMNWENKIHPDDRDRVLKVMALFIAGERRDQFNEAYRFLKADGTYAEVIDKGFCLYDEEGKVIRMIGSVEDVTERKKMEEQLLQQEIQKHQQIAQAVVDVQENERAEIGKELHDNINQLLTTAKLFLEVAENDEKMRVSLIRRSSDTIMGAINEIRKISRSLMPASISDLGLITSVNDLIQNVAIARQLLVDFRYDANLDNLLHSKQKLMIFRIIQEQVNNVIKHSRASSLIIAISHNPQRTRLEIADNGVGFDPQKARLKDGVGLSNIMSRAAIFNATVEINTSPGKGCQIIIDLPNFNKSTNPNE